LHQGGKCMYSARKSSLSRHWSSLFTHCSL